MRKIQLSLTAFFAFVRRERIYFLALLFCLALTLLSSRATSEDHSNTAPSAELQLLEERTQNWNEKIQDPEVLLDQISEHPFLTIAWLGSMAVFMALFFGGGLLNILYLFFPPVRNYFRDASPVLAPVLLTGSHLFRVVILAYVSWVLTMLLSGLMTQMGALNENGLGITQTLLLDGLVCFSIYAVLRDSGITWSHFMGKPESYWREIARGIAEYAAFFPWFLISLIALLGISAWFHYEPPPHPLIHVFLEEENRSPWIFYGAILLASVVAPILEEIFFRGFCYRFLRGYCGAGYAIVFSAALFAALHGSWFTLIPIFVLGAGLARLYEKRGNFIACWTFHLLHNILFTVYFFSAKAMLEAFHG